MKTILFSCVLLSLLGVVGNVMACEGDEEMVAEYLFLALEDGAVLNTGLDEDNGNLFLQYGASLETPVPPINASCGLSLSLPDTGSGQATPHAVSDAAYDPFFDVEAFVIMAWVKRESASASANSSARILSDVSSLSTTAGAANGVEFRFSGSAGNLALRINGQEVSATTGGIAPTNSDWHHVAVVYDGTRADTNYATRNVHFYVDGIQRGHGNSLPGLVVGGNTAGLTLGNSAVSRSVANLLVGALDDVLVLVDFAPEPVGNGNLHPVIQCYMERNDDIEPPEITAPADVTVYAGACLAPVTNVSLGTPAASDNCTLAGVSNNAPAVFPIGNTIVTWTATDLAGNTAQDTQTVSVLPSQTEDCDGDSLTDWEEWALHGTDPLAYSTSGDGISDGWKVQYGLDPTEDVPATCLPRYW